MATLAFGLILTSIANRWIEFTGGTSGLPVRQLAIGGEMLTRVQVYFVVLVVAGAVLLLHDFIVRSHVGRALQAIRDDETAASALGVHVTRYKLRMFVLAAVIAGLAGICFSLVSLRVDPSLGEFRVLVTLLTIAVVGGLGTRFGPLLGSIIIILLPQILTKVGDLETLIYGGFVLIFLIFLPNGIAGLIERASWRRLFAKPAAAGSQV
jgi:branched-chain amino acid transport system permease protein